MIRKVFYILLIITNLFYAQSAGNSGLSFLKFGSGSRNIAMSDLGVIAGNELNAVIYNPSILSVLNKSQLSFSHNQLILDLRSELLGGSFYLFDIPFAVFINTSTISDIEIRIIPGATISQFNANYFFASLSSSFEIMKDFYSGFSLKYIYENLYSDEATGYAIDFGLTYSGLMKGLSIGASIRNIGAMNKLRNEETVLPKDLRLGASYSYNFTDTKLFLTLLTGLQKYLESDNYHFHTGTEINYDDFFFIRAGYMSGYESKSVTTGFGIKIKSLNLDYAYVPFKYGLGDNHIITFIFTF